MAYSEDGRPVYDDEPNIRAYAELRKASESLRKLVGADAPVHTKVETIEHSQLDAAIEAELSALGLFDATSPAE